jgi:RNA polymerase primary sigma factor
MEAELKPQVLETFDRIAKTYKKLRKLQDQQVAEKTALSPSQERRYKKLKEEIIADVKSLSLNRTASRPGRAALRHQQAADLAEGRLLRLAESYKCEARPTSSTQYQGAELDAELAAARVAAERPRAGRISSPRRRTTIKEIRAEIHSLASETGLQISEFRRIVQRCRRASARRASPRRKWSRPTCAS